MNLCISWLCKIFMTKTQGLKDLKSIKKPLLSNGFFYYLFAFLRSAASILASLA